MGSYDLSLRALSHYRTLSKADMVAALDLFNRAIELDPEFGSALGFAIVCHGNIIVNGWSEAPQKDAQDAQALIQRAIKVARNDPEVLLNVAIGIMMTGGDRATAATFAERAVALNPGSSNVWFGIGMVRLQSGEPQLAFDCFETSLRLNPLSPYRPVFLGMEGMALFAQGRFADAIPLLRQSAELAPEWPFPTPVLAASYAHVGDTDAARSAIARHRMVSPVEARDTRWPESATEKLLIDGIAIAEGRAPMAGPSSG
jgi:adenylate cyclase